MRIIETDRGGWLEYQVSGNLPVGGFSLKEKEPRLCKLLETSDAALVRLYGECGSAGGEFEELLSGKPGMVSRFINPERVARDTAGVFAFLIRVKEGTAIRGYDFGRGGKAWVVEAPGARMGLLAGVAAEGRRDVVGAYRKTFADTVKNIRGLGFAPADIKRTWCYFSDVLSEYAAFNRVRREIFIQAGVPADALPASTGAQSIPKNGEPLMMDALAYSGTSVRSKSLSNPGQCDPAEYGVLFSRAVHIKGAGPEQWLVSGMASISETGETLHAGDIEAQIQTTVDKAAILLDSFGLDWASVCAGIAYLHPDYYRAAMRKMSGSVLHELDFAVAAGHICRRDLLFEIEFMAFGR